MSNPQLLADSRIAILGLGLMGGSLAMALKGHCKQILGVDPNPAAVAYARKHNIVDIVAENPYDILPRADIVILAAPVGAILKLIRSLPELHPGEAIVLDIGSTKAVIVSEMEKLPSRFDPLGGHPMCGKEKLSLTNAEEGLFQEATFAFTPCENTSNNAYQFAEQLSKAIGATSLWLEADTHDLWTAATSHFPYLVATALTLTTPMDSAPLVGTGFKSTTRIAATPASLMLDIIATNQINIIESLDLFMDQIDQIRALLRTNDLESLKIILEQSALHHEQILPGRSRIESK